MLPNMGPPLPQFLQLYWPWYGIALTAGINEVTYRGKRQVASEAMASIEEYLEIAYYLHEEGGVQILADTMLKPGMKMSVRVTQDCLWVF